MKRLVAVVLAVLSAVVAMAQMGNVSSLVKITDMAGGTGWEVLDAEGLKELKKQIAEEAKLFPVLLVEARKQWAAAKNVKGQFPSSQVKVRKFSVAGTGTEEKLETMKERRESSQADKMQKEADLAQKKLNNIKNEDMKAKIQEKEDAKRKIRGTAVALMTKLLKERLSRDIPSYSAEVMSYAEELEFDAPEKK